MGNHKNHPQTNEDQFDSLITSNEEATTLPLSETLKLRIGPETFELHVCVLCWGPVHP